jgi:SAM-dependent methyltransferase
MEPGRERGTPVPASPSAIQKQQLVQTEGLTRFTAWLFEQIEPFLNGAVWEAGCGTGTYTQHMLARGCGPIVATDLDEDVLTVARRRFDGDPRVAVFDLDLGKPDEYRKLTHTIQTIVCLNVLEHLEDDRMTLRQMRQLLPPGGRLLLLVPAHPMLFNGIDESVHHYRRYTARELREKLQSTGFRVVRSYYFNALGIVGWVLYGHILGRRSVPETPAALFDRVIPLARWVERVVLRGRVGVSLIAICEA